jgi:hypothetical protein
MGQSHQNGSTKEGERGGCKRNIKLPVRVEFCLSQSSLLSLLFWRLSYGLWQRSGRDTRDINVNCIHNKHIWGVWLVTRLRYKPEGPGFDYRWVHCIFSIILILAAALLSYGRLSVQQIWVPGIFQEVRGRPAPNSCNLTTDYEPCKIWGFHGVDYEEWCLLGCYAVWFL